jgi:GNAT superfamily N-acetyltransferase
VIRELRAEDAPALAELLRVLEPLWPTNAEAVLDDARRQPPEAQRRAWVAPGGTAHARRLWEVSADVGSLWVGVEPARRRRGLGGELYAVALEHLRLLGVARAKCWAFGDGAEFLVHRGWEADRERIVSVVELTSPREIEPLAGAELAPLRDVDPHALFELDRLCGEDEPGDTIDFGSFENYRRTELERPLLDLDASRVVLVEGRPVALAMLFRLGALGHSGFTCTHPEWRGRGLAALAKSAMLQRAFELGVERVATMNDAENAPMLRVNAKLGYRPVRRETQFVLRTTGTPSTHSSSLTAP